MFVSVPLTVQVAKPVVHSSLRSTDEEIMKSCPKKDLLKEENLYLTIEVVIYEARTPVMSDTDTTPTLVITLNYVIFSNY